MQARTKMSPTGQFVPISLGELLGEAARATRDQSGRRVGRGVTRGTGDRWRLVDLRSRDSYRRGHVGGSLSLPLTNLADSLFLLPPRSVPVAFLHRRPEIARQAAQFLSTRGWSRVGWLDGGLGGTLSAANAAELVSGTESVVLWEPAESLAEHTSLLRGFVRRFVRRHPDSPPKAFDLACGSGRNGVHLARLGFDVTGVDILDDALWQARQVARGAGAGAGSSSGTTASFHRGDLTSPRALSRWLRPEQWDVILVYRYLDRSVLAMIQRALAPGGLLFYETFLEEQARVHGRPRRPEFLLKKEELRAAFGALEIVHYREGPDREDNRLSTLVARRVIREVSLRRSGV